MAIIGRGQLTLSDLNDAIISGTQPSSPTNGTLWIDNSINPNMLKQWNGSAWINIGELDPSMSVTISNIQNTLGNMANDSKIDFQERQTIRDRIAEIIGYVPYDKNIYKADFTGKIYQSTVVNPHTFKGTNSSSLLAPSSITFEHIQANMDRIKTLDGTKFSDSINTNGGRIQSLFSFDMIQEVERKMGTIPSSTLAGKISWIKTNMKSITINWYGHGSSPLGNKAYLSCWHVVNGNWTTNITNHTQSTVTLLSMIIDGSLASSIDANGFIHFLAYADASNGTVASVINTDFVEINTIMYNTLPVPITLDGLGYGDFYNARRQAIVAGISTSDAKYVAVASEWNNLKTYLESSPVVDAWDISQLNKDYTIDVDKSQFRTTWLKYYTAVNDLATATAQQLKTNVDNVTVGGTNYASNGHFEIPLTSSLWASSYVGGTKEIVDISAETPPFQFAYHVKNTVDQNGGIFAPTLWTGVVAEQLVNKEVTVSFWLKYQNIVQGSQTYMLGRFGEIIVEGETAGAVKVYSYTRVSTTNTPTTSGYFFGTDMAWKKYYATIKLSLPATAVKITNISFKHGIEGCTGEFWTTGIQVEMGNKVTDFAPSPLDVQDRLKKAELKITDTSIIATVTGSTNWSTISQKADRIDIVVNPADSTIKADAIATAISLTPTAISLISNNIDLTGRVSFSSFDVNTQKNISSEATLINPNFNFMRWSGQLPDEASGLLGTAPTKVASTNTIGTNAVKFTTTAGSNNYFGFQNLGTYPFYQNVYLETTFMLESGSINGAGILFRWMKADGVSILYDRYLKLSDFVSSPVVGKWYTVSTILNVPSSVDFSKYYYYVMGSYVNIDATNPAKTIQFDSVKIRPATLQESNVNSWTATGKTTINGGLIETDTVTATQILVTDLSSISANIGTITAGSITGVNITGVNIYGSLYESKTTVKSVTIQNGKFISNDCGTSSGGVINQQTIIEDGRVSIRNNVSDREIRIYGDSIAFWSLNDGSGTDSSASYIEYYLDGSLNDCLRISSTHTLDLSGLTNISWGTNKPVAVFG